MLLPVALYGLEVPAGDVLIPAVPDFPATFRITMAAIDPSAPPEEDGTSNGSSRPRATLKLLRQPIGPGDDEDSDDDDYLRNLLEGSDDEDDSSEDEEEANGGPSDPTKSKKARKAAALKQLMASMDDEDDDEDTESAPNGTNGVVKADKKGKAPATGDEADDDDEDESDSDDEDLEIEEFVICTLDPEKIYQQALDITVGEDERVFFKVSGTHTIYLTGNYVIPDDNGHNHHHEVYDSDDDEDDDEDYDLSPDEDEIDMEIDEDESDDLDDIDNPQITELESDEEEAPKLVVKQEKKGKNKRVAVEEAETLDEIMAEAADTSAPAEKLSKKQLKKMKNNKGEAVASKVEEAKKDGSSKDASKSDKKVQFAKQLEQGPTGTEAKAGSKADKKSETSSKTTLGVKVVNGVKIDDKKLGKGPAAKKGDKVGMRYIGKLVDGKVFDSNKKGKPFTFKLGAGDVIEGWDIGVAGMSVGSERRITIPANLGYGSKAIPGIPANSTLVFDVKLIEIK